MFFWLRHWPGITALTCSGYFEQNNRRRPRRVNPNVLDFMTAPKTLRVHVEGKKNAFYIQTLLPGERTVRKRLCANNNTIRGVREQFSTERTYFSNHIIFFLLFVFSNGHAKRVYTNWSVGILFVSGILTLIQSTVNRP
jgi:hypothetical protein